MNNELKAFLKCNTQESFKNIYEKYLSKYAQLECISLSCKKSQLTDEHHHQGGSLLNRHSSKLVISTFPEYFNRNLMR